MDHKETPYRFSDVSRRILLTSRSNTAAMRMYAKAGGKESVNADEVSFTWDFKANT